MKPVRFIIAAVLGACLGAALAATLTTTRHPHTLQGDDSGADGGPLRPHYVRVRGMDVPLDCFTTPPSGYTVEGDGAILNEDLKPVGSLPPRCAFLEQQDKNLKYSGSYAQWGILWFAGPGGSSNNGGPIDLADGGVYGSYWWFTQAIGTFVVPPLPLVSVPPGGHSMTFWPGLEGDNVMQPVFSPNPGSGQWTNNFVYCCDAPVALPLAFVSPGTIYMWGEWVDSRFPCDTTGIGCHFLMASEYGGADASAFSTNYLSITLHPGISSARQDLPYYFSPNTWEGSNTSGCVTSGGAANGCANYPYNDASADGSVGGIAFTISSVYEVFHADGAAPVPVYLTDGGVPTQIPVFPPFPDPGLAPLDGSIFADFQTSSGVVRNVATDAGNNGTGGGAPVQMCGCNGSAVWDGGALVFSWHP